MFEDISVIANRYFAKFHIVENVASKWHFIYALVINKT